MDIKEKIAWLRLARSENIGPITFRELLKFHGSAQQALEAIPEMAKKGGKKNISLCSSETANKEYEKTIAFGGDIITAIEPEYPDLLKQTHGYPPVISIVGDKSLLANQCIAMVGTRNASITGKQIAKKIAYDLTEEYTVVSGLALGIDKKAHEGALLNLNGKKTIAVIGCGIDVCYPEQNKEVYNQIKEQALIISEFPLSSSPQAMNFPRRNRIISGLSLGVIVIEAQKRSGSLITARMALEQNREVFAVPGSPLDTRGSGPNLLIKQGATLIESASDVLQALETKENFTLKEDFLPIEEPDFSKVSECDIDNARKIILENLSTNSITVDNIIYETGFSHSIVSVVLLELELAGRLEKNSSGSVSLISG